MEDCLDLAARAGFSAVVDPAAPPVDVQTACGVTEPASPASSDLYGAACYLETPGCRDAPLPDQHPDGRRLRRLGGVSFAMGNACYRWQRQAPIADSCFPLCSGSHRPAPLWSTKCGMPRKPNAKRRPSESYQTFTALLDQMERLIQEEDIQWHSSLTTEAERRLARIARALRRSPHDRGDLLPRSGQASA
jgi:hypothetical protein